MLGLAWDKSLARCVGIFKADSESTLKSADWKVAIAWHLKQTQLCWNG
jgi:hypothetical protein